MTPSLSLLVERLEAGESSRELADEVLLVCGWTVLDRLDVYTYWQAPDGVIYNRYTNPLESVDAALTLVPEGFYVQLFQRHDGWFCRLKCPSPYNLIAPFEDNERIKTYPPARALCIANLKARQSRERV